MNPASPSSPEVNPPTEMRFVHKFKCGVTATATISKTKYEVEWSEKPKLKDVEKEYLAWQEVIFREFTEATGLSVMVVTI